MSRNKFLLNVCIALFFAGMVGPCGGGPAGPKLSPVREDVVGNAESALKAYQRGDAELALFYYSEALRLSRSVDDIPATALYLNSVAAAHRRLGNAEEAHSAVDQVLTAEHLTYPREQRAEAAMIKAVLYKDEGAHEAALEWTGEAIATCADCPASYRYRNLKARVLSLSGEHVLALETASAALTGARFAEDRPEEANALRVMADSQTALGRYGEARGLYAEALSIDKALGLSSKVAADLLGFGDAAKGEGRMEEALGYYLRALEAGRAGGHRQAETRARTAIEDLKAD
jgi:tetratricopeptide (TPR) repeat protein